MPDNRTATNVRTGAHVTTETPTADEAYVAALLRERETYERYGRADRVKDVDAELKRCGVSPDEDAPQAAPKENAAESKPRRTARGTKS